MAKVVFLSSGEQVDRTTIESLDRRGYVVLNLGGSYRRDERMELLSRCDILYLAKGWYRCSEGREQRKLAGEMGMELWGLKSG